MIDLFRRLDSQRFLQAYFEVEIEIPELEWGYCYNKVLYVRKDLLHEVYSSPSCLQDIRSVVEKSAAIPPGKDFIIKKSFVEIYDLNMIQSLYHTFNYWRKVR